MIALGLAFGALVGLALGLLGGGGAILAVPTFVYVLGVAARPAIAMSLGVVAVTSLVGAVIHARAGRVHGRVAITFGAAAMAGSFAGARAAALVSPATQLTVFALAMLGAAASMAFRSAHRGGDVRSTGTARPGVVVLAAVAVGVLTGLAGVGGGFLIVPVLVTIAGLPMKDAVGTSLAIIAMSAAAGAVGYVGRVDIAWPMAAAFTAAALAGLAAGARLMARVPAPVLQRAFAVLLVLTGGFVLYQNRAAFGPTPAASAPTGVSR